MNNKANYKIVAELRADGVPYKEISERLGMPLCTLYRYMKRARAIGYAPQFRPKKRLILLGYPAGAVRHALKKLTDEQQYWIASQIPTGMTIAEFMVSFMVDAYNDENPSL